MLKLYWADDDCLLPGDRGLAYGDGLFETIRVNGDSAPLLVYHLDRLVRDAGRLGISLSRPELESAVAGAMQRYGAIHGGSHWVLKLVVTRGSGGRGYRP
ncbi:MAG TPA: aminodeoxychorismate lyase, partial [Marinobacter hydrocarbonoclasticus]